MENLFKLEKTESARIYVTHWNSAWFQC